MLNYEGCEERDQLLDYLLLCGVTLPKSIRKHHAIVESKRRIHSRLLDGLKVMKLCTDDQSNFKVLPNEIKFEIALDAACVKYPKLPRDLLLKMLQEYVYQIYFEKVCRLIEKKEFETVDQIISSFPALFQWKSIDINDYEAGFNLLDVACCKAYRDEDYLNFALKLIQLNHIGPKNDDYADLINDALRCNDDRLLNHLLFCDVEIPERFIDNQRVKKAQDSINAVISIGNEALKKEGDPQKALDAMIAKCPWLGGFPSKFVLEKLSDPSPKIMIKV